MTPRIISFLLLILFAMQSFQHNLVVLDYVANIETFIELCINKDRPELKCKGKCQMMKKIQAEEEKNQKNPDHKGENRSQTLYHLTDADFTLSQPDTSLTVYPNYTISFPACRPSTIFHPPTMF